MLLLSAVLWMWCGRSRHPARPAPAQEAANPVAVVAPAEPEHGQEDVGGSGLGFTVVSSRPAPRPGIPPSAELLAKARLHLVAGGREGSCGPYSLLEDMADPILLETCNLLATELDDTYRQRLGVAPLSEPAATILLFSHRDGYRVFSEQQGIQASGYAGHTSPSQGYAAIWADPSRPDDFAKTLVHELTHLVNRRSLGGNLPRWLSEGLADALGDTATLEGIQPLTSFEGAEGQAERLRLAYETNQAGSVARLVALEPTAFDRGVVSYDYEQSTLLVRYLLLDPELAPRFLGFLVDLAEGAPYSPELLRKHLVLGWPVLDNRLQAWLGFRPGY